MKQNENVKNWITCWNAVNGNVNKKTASDEAEKLWNERAESLVTRFSPTNLKKDQKRTDEILNFLAEAGFRAEGAKVLDIGCGPGALSIPLARAGAKVTSLDISSKALDHIQAIADSEGLSVQTIANSWWISNIDKLGFRKKFDLVIASKTPAVNDVETFDWMMACSRKYCFFSSFFHLGGKRIPAGFQDLYRILNIEPDRSEQSSQINKPSSFFYPFMYLYLKEYRPQVRITHMRRKEIINWMDAANHAIEVIGQSHKITKTTKEKILAYYEQSAKMGKSHSESDMYTGMMVWKSW